MPIASHGCAFGNGVLDHDLHRYLDNNLQTETLHWEGVDEWRAQSSRDIFTMHLPCKIKTESHERLSILIDTSRLMKFVTRCRDNRRRVDPQYVMPEDNPLQLVFWTPKSYWTTSEWEEWSPFIAFASWEAGVHNTLPGQTCGRTQYAIHRAANGTVLRSTALRGNDKLQSKKHAREEN